jgi:hypothetical protein
VAEDNGKEEEKFDFTPEGEVLDYISLQQAVLLSRRQARESDERYKERLGWEEIVWAELRSETVGEDYYRIVLQFRRPTRGILEEQTGEEEFLFDLTGVLQDRQVLLWPESLSAGQGEVDTTAMPQLEVSALQPAEPPSIAEALTSPPDFPHAEPTERRSEASPNGEEGGAPDTSEVELGTSTTYQTLLQCTQCKTEYSPGSVFCTACGTVISDATVPPPSTMPGSTTYIQSDDRPLGTSTLFGRTSLTARLHKIGAIVLGLWGVLLLLVGGVSLSEEEQLIWWNLLIMAGGLATMVGAGLLWPWTKLQFGRVGSRWVIIGLPVGGFVAFVVGAVLTVE